MRAGLTKVVWSLMLLCGVASTAFTQEGTVRGRVTDASTGQGISGAQVVVLGAGRGTLTGATGEFVIASVPSGVHSVSAHILGYGTKQQAVTVQAGQPARVDLALSVSSVTLDELVVTGQPEATRRRTVGSSVASIDAAPVVDRVPVTSVAQLLQGREAGVMSLGASGTTGTAGSLVLRGVSSITQRNSPAIYVDGIRVDASEKPLFLIGLGGQTTSRLNDLNPADIERVEVVKGAAASALYGSEASNGVIQVFTKKGRSGESTMNASVRVGESRIPNVFPLTHPDAKYPSANDLLRNGRYQQYNVSLRGGNDQIRHYVSGTYMGDEGSFSTNEFNRASGLLNLWVMPADQLTAEFTSNVSWSKARLPFNDNQAAGILINVLAGNPTKGTTADPYGGLFLPATYAISLNNTDETFRYSGGLTLQHRPWEAFGHKATLGLELVSGNGTTQYPYAPNPLRPRGARLVADRENVSANFDYTATLTTQHGAIGSTLSAGAQVYTLRDNRAYSSGSAFPSPFLTLLGAATTSKEIDEEILEYSTGGVFVQEQLAFGDRLFVTAGLRVDGSTAFGDDFGTQAYPKASVSYVVSDESWFSVPTLSSLRLRAGIGRAGTQPGAFDAMRTYVAVTGGGGLPGLRVGEIGNPELAPEVSQEVEGGFDAAFFDDRLSLNATAYKQVTRDALLRRQVAPSLGYGSTQLVNVGEVQNRGVELGGNATLVRTRRLSWSANATYAYNENEVTDMAGIAPITIDRFGSRVQEGYPLGGKWQVVQESTDANGLPVASAAPVYVGSGMPPHNGSVGSILGFGAFEVFANAQWAAGHVVTNNTRAYQIQRRTGAEYFNLVAANNDNAVTPTSLPVRSLVARSNMLGEFTEDADWLKLREVGVTYAIPARFATLVGASRASLNVSGRNLWTATRYSGPDPEIAATVGYFNTAVPVVGQDLFTMPSVGNDFFTVPQSRQLVVGFDVQF